MIIKNFKHKNDTFLDTYGNKFVYDNEEITMKGFGLGNWLIFEPFMLGIPGTDLTVKNCFVDAFGQEKSDYFWDNLYESYINEDDIAYIKSLGANLVRIPFSYTHFLDDRTPNIIKDTGFKHIDRVVDLCAKHDLLVVLDLHSAPGSQNRDVHGSTTTGKSLFWDFRALQDTVINMWTAVASHYADNPVVAGYDVLNEPVFIPDVDVFNRFYNDLIKSIRTVDTNHIIFLEGDMWAKDFSLFELNDTTRVAWTYHLYPINVMADYGDDTWNPESYRMEVKKILNSMSKYDIPVWCGETGIHYNKDQHDLANPPQIDLQAPMLNDALDILNEFGHSWSTWVYKDCGSMGITSLAIDSPWKKNLVDGISQVFPTNETSKKLSKLTDDLCELFKVSDDKNNIEDYVLREIIFYTIDALKNEVECKKIKELVLKKLSPDEFDTLTNSWRFVNTERTEFIEKILKSKY